MHVREEKSEIYSSGTARDMTPAGENDNRETGEKSSGGKRWTEWRKHGDIEARYKENEGINKRANNVRRKVSSAIKPRGVRGSN